MNAIRTLRNPSLALVLLVLAGSVLALGPRPVSSGGDALVLGLDRMDRDERLTFADPNAPRSLVIDNIFGSITIVPHDGDDVRLAARAAIDADSRHARERALEEVSLRIERAGGEISVLVDGPFRRDDRVRWDDHLGYRVSYDFEIEVPRRTDLDLRTIDGGRIDVRGVTGEIVAHNVNGSIEMRDIAGAGLVKTVNGGIELGFAERPTGNWKLETVNGDLDTTFPSDLSADLAFKTFNGEVYTDFDYQTRPLGQSVERHDGRFRVESRGFGVRIGAGGPEIAFESLNGDILVRNQDR